MTLKLTTWKKWTNSEKYNFPRLNQEEIKNNNRLIRSMEIETEIKNVPTNESPEQITSQLNSTKN